MKLYITQLIYIIPGEEQVFDEFEALAIPLISKYKGRLMLRIRPGDEAYIEGDTEKPYEIHLVEFDSQEDFERFMKDDSRNQFLHLKNASMRSSLLISGHRL